MAKRKGSRKQAQRKAFKQGLRAIVRPEQIHASPKDYLRHRETRRIREEIERDLE